MVVSDRSGDGRGWPWPWVHSSREVGLDDSVEREIEVGPVTVTVLTIVVVMRVLVLLLLAERIMMWRGGRKRIRGRSAPTAATAAARQ